MGDSDEGAALDIYRAQIEWIEEHFGKGAQCNLGWSEGAPGEILTKVYTKGLLASRIENGEIVHEFKSFDELKEQAKELWRSVGRLPN